MIDNARLSIVVGGYYHCTPEWDEDVETYRFDPNFAFFLPTSGEATMETKGGSCRMTPGNVYFIPGIHMVRQRCPKSMSVYWINFVTESYYLGHRLNSIKAIHQWPLETVPGIERIFRRFVEFFEDPETDDSRMRKDPPAALAMMIEGALMVLLANLLELTESEYLPVNKPQMERLKPAIDFMDDHFLNNPSLEEIARQVGLAPQYFHRAFKEQAGFTPFKYIENRRLDHARKLLFDRRLSVKEVAFKTGYHSVNYFCRAFRRRFERSPNELRTTPQTAVT